MDERMKAKIRYILIKIKHDCSFFLAFLITLPDSKKTV